MPHAHQVVFGIIVDTFSELRDEKQQIQEAMNSECFICSRKAYEFDRYGTAFNEHVKTEHHQWNYLYYMLYLEDLDHTDYDSNQQYFHTALASEAEATVFPINKARCLAKMEDEAEDSAIMNTKILDQLATLLAKMDKMEKSVSEKTALPALPGSPSRPAADAMADFDFDFDDNVATRASVSSDPREDDL
jgi:inositol 1,4,5-triphosphate receptor type 1